jgi:DNA gyrase subunit A
MTVDNFKSQNRGGKGIRGMQTIDDDYIVDLLMTSNHHYVMFLTNMGKAYRLKAYQIPEAGRNARGTAIINLIQLQPGEKISAVIPVKEFSNDKFLFMTTKRGIVKKTPLIEFANMRKTGLQAINLKDDDELIEVKTTNNKRDIFLITKYGMCIRFNENDVRKTGRTSMGVIGMSLEHGDEVVGMQMNTQGDSLLIVSENGLGKRTSIDEFKVQKRGGKGVKCYKINDKTGYVIGVKAVNDEHEIMMITNEGVIIQFHVNNISMIGRNTFGVKLINIEKNEDIKVAKIAKVRANPKGVEDEVIKLTDNNDIIDEELNNIDNIENEDNMTE